MNSLNIDHLRTWIGREQRLEDSLEPFRARALAAALDHQALPQSGDELPPCWHWLYFAETPPTAGTGEDGHPHKGGLLPPVPLPRRMWSAGSVVLAAPLRLGERAEKRSTVRSIEEKSGKTGALVFVGVEHELTQNGKTCIREKQTLVYRPMPTAATPLPPGEAPPSHFDWSHRVAATSVLLFRYSALTYNAHRIHYDREYAIREELYPGLVVHGPLLVTLLLDLALRHSAAGRMEEFEFRAIRPTFDAGPIELRGQSDGRAARLWSIADNNFVGMHVSARFGAGSR